MLVADLTCSRGIIEALALARVVSILYWGGMHFQGDCTSKRTSKSGLAKRDRALFPMQEDPAVHKPDCEFVPLSPVTQWSSR